MLLSFSQYVLIFQRNLLLPWSSMCTLALYFQCSVSTYPDDNGNGFSETSVHIYQNTRRRSTEHPNSISRVVTIFQCSIQRNLTRLFRGKEKFVLMLNVKAYKWMEVQLLSFLTSRPDGGGRSASRTDWSNPKKTDQFNRCTEDSWASQPVWTVWKRGKFVGAAGSWTKLSRSPVHILDTVRYWPHYPSSRTHLLSLNNYSVFKTSF
jgi:hypothetical protein